MICLASGSNSSSILLSATGILIVVLSIICSVNKVLVVVVVLEILHGNLYLGPKEGRLHNRMLLRT